MLSSLCQGEIPLRVLVCTGVSPRYEPSRNDPRGRCGDISISSVIQCPEYTYIVFNRWRHAAPALPRGIAVPGTGNSPFTLGVPNAHPRSEERRVGKEWRCRWSAW